MGMDQLKRHAMRSKHTSPGDSLQKNHNVPATSLNKARRRTLGPKFEETHIRFTSYFRHDVYDRIEQLRDEGKIANLKDFINDAATNYIDLYYE